MIAAVCFVSHQHFSSAFHPQHAQALKPGSGVCLVAAKSYYFGVGGSTAAFRQQATAAGLVVQQAAVLDDGASNKREILSLTWAHMDETQP